MGVRSIARELGISPAQASKLAKRGMPTDDLQAAIRWRDIHLDPRWQAKEPPAPPPPPDPRMQLVAHVLHYEVPKRLWKPNVLALAAVEVGIVATPEQLIDMNQMAAVLWMEVICQALGDDEGEQFFDLPEELLANTGSPEHAALVERLGELMEWARRHPMKVNRGSSSAAAGR